MNKVELKSTIEMVFNNFIHSIERHDDINTKRTDGGWSVGQIADHIVKATDTNLGATKKTIRPYDVHAQSIKNVFLDFEKKFSSAPDIVPDERHYTKVEVIGSLQKNLKRIFRMIDTEDLTETCIDWEVPGWGNLTKYECLVLFEFHTIRHTKQIDEFTLATA